MSAPMSWRSEVRWALVGAVLLIAGLYAVFGEVWRHELDTFVPTEISRPDGVLASGEVRELLLGDQRFVAWLVSRNAYTLLEDPGSLYQAEPCFPADGALALGEPGITMGLIAMPFFFLSGDPIITYNLALVALVALGCLAMYILVRGWTGVPAAGIVAALLYGFHEIKIGDIGHPYGYDTSAFVLGLFFATRLLDRARWRDAVGLACCGAFLLAGSFYPTLSCLLVAVPLLPSFLMRAGWRAWSRIAVVVPVLFIVGAFLFEPYLALRAEGVLAPRALQFFMPWSHLAPSGKSFPGWTLLVLAAVALIARNPGNSSDTPAPPRWGLLLGGLLALLLAGGGQGGDFMEAVRNPEFAGPSFPNPYPWLAGFVPGLDNLRGPFGLVMGAHLALSILAGLGAASLLKRLSHRSAILLAIALIAVAWVDTFRPPGLGFSPRVEYGPANIKPPDGMLRFFEDLRAQGNAGPILEIPVAVFHSSHAVLLSAYHRRRTSHCYTSYLPPSFAVVEELASRLPAPPALAGLREMGFTTIIVHHGEAQPLAKVVVERLRVVAQQSAGRELRLLLASGEATAFELRPEHGSRDGGAENP